MVGSRPATATHDTHAVVGDKMFVILRQLCWLEFVDRPPSFIVRQAGVGQNRDILGAVHAQIANRIIHLDRPGGTVQPDHVYVERLEGSQCRADFSAQQHRARSFKGYLNCDRQPLARFLHGIKDAH